MLEKSRRKLGSKKGLTAVFMAILLIGAMVFFSTMATAAEQKVITLKYSSGMMPFDPVNMQANHLLDLVEQKTNGRVKIERFMGGALGAPLEHLGLVKSGAVDIITLWVDQFMAEVPLHLILGTSQVVSAEQGLANLIALTREIPETKALLDAEQKRNNIKVLYWHDQGSAGITAGFPAKSLADLKGKKLNTIASFHRTMFEELGWIPVNVQVPELYEALSRGVIDAIIMGTAAILPLKWNEIAKAQLVLGENVTFSQPLTLNLDVWNRLPGDVQQAFMEASLETAQWTIGGEKAMTEKTYATLKESGVPVVRVSAKEDKLFWDIDGRLAMEMYLSNAKKMGVKDQAAVIQKYWADMRVGKWKK